MNALQKGMRKVRWALSGARTRPERLRIFWRIARWEVSGRLGLKPVVQVQNKRFAFRCHFGDGSARLLYYFRVLEPDFQRILSHCEGKRVCAVDVGAHIGTLAVPLAKVAATGSSVFAFEPQTLIGHRLLDNADLNGVSERVHLVGKCLGDKPGEAEFFLNLRDTSRSRQVERDHHRRPEESSTKVPVTTLDLFAAEAGIEAIDFMKVDVEGHEIEVFRGASGLLKQRRIRLICFEFMPDAHHVDPAADPRECLRSAGYEVSERPPFEAPQPVGAPRASLNLWAWPKRALPTDAQGEASAKPGAA